MKKTGSEIIEFILSDLDIKAPTFAVNIGVAYSRIHDIQREKTKNISAELANKIASKYPQYNIRWIISGDGDIYKGTLSERLDKYISHKGIDLNVFLNSIKMTSPRYALVMSSNIKKDELDMIYTNYPDLNPDWLLEGKGEMLKSDVESPLQINEARGITIPYDAWEVIKLQAKSLEKRDNQIDELIALLKDSKKDIADIA